MSELDARQVEQKYHAMAAAGEYAQALELITRYSGLFPYHAQPVVYYWRINMACRLGNAPLALELLRQAINEGHCFDDLSGDPDLHLLVGLPEFPRLAALSAERRLEQIARTVPVMKVLEPSGSAGPYPMVFALHGNSGNVESFASHWEAARRHGWLVALPQAPESFGSGSYSWNDWDWAIPFLVEQYARVIEDFAVDPERVVLAGFSMGAGLALWLAFQRRLRARGVLAVAPFLSEVGRFEPLLAAPESRSLRVYLVASPQDEYCHSVAVRLSSLLPDHGIAHELDLYADIGHAFPPSFGAQLPAALDFLLENS